MKWISRTVTLLLIICAPCLATAEDFKAIDAKVESFIKAYTSADELAIEKEWNVLNQAIGNNEEIVDYLRQNKKFEYSLFKMKGLNYRVQRIQRKYYGRSAIRDDSKPGSASNRLRGGRSNRSKVTSSPNKDRPRNQVRVRRSNSEVSRTNRDRIRTSPNRTRAREQSNQRRIRSRRFR